MDRKWSVPRSSISLGDDDNVGLFLEALENSVKSINEKKINYFKEVDEELSNLKLIDEKSFHFYTNEDLLCINNEEKEKLYCEIIYTIQHKIGQTIDGHTDFIFDLYKYSQEAFKMTTQDHDRLFQMASEEKPPALILNCEVIEACNLEAKDPNGFSDPYCMLGIIPGNRIEECEIPTNLCKLPTVQNFNLNQPPQITPNSSHKSSIIKRFSSFRRSEKHTSNTTTNNNNNTNLVNNSTNSSNLNKKKSIPNSNLKLSGIIRDKLPAKYIQTTDVKKATLNPVWRQKFRLQIDDIKADTLHLDIWDHDDESSVFDAAKKLNEVKGFKGLDRYFKQIAQSARTNKEENVDDFLGSVNILIDDLPSSGIDKWYELEGRTEKSKVEGKIRLRLKLATKEDRGEEGENAYELKQQEKMLRIFINHELSKLKSSKNNEWRGDLSREAETILHQHSIQGDMNDFQIAMSRWIAFSKSHLEKEISYKLLLDKLEKLDQVWSSSSPSKEESECLKESLDLFIKHCFKLIQNLREAFPVTKNRLGLEKLEYVLRILSKIFNMNAFKYCFPFQNSLIHELVLVIKNASNDWFDRTADGYFRKSEDDSLKKLIEFTYLVYSDLLIAQNFYDSIFKIELNIDYFTILYKKIESKLMDLIEKIIIEEFGEDIKKFPAQVLNLYGQMINVSDSTTKSRKDESSPVSNNLMINYVTITEQIAIELFELYSLIHLIEQMKTYLCENDQTYLAINKFHDLFYMPYKRWIDIIKKRVENKIEKCFDNEKNDVLTELTKVSSSSIEISNLFNQTTRLWKLINWPEFIGSQMFFSEIIDCFSKGITRYATLIQENNNKNLSNQNLQSGFNLSNQNLKYQKFGSELDIYQRLVITSNNLEKVRESFKQFLIDLDFEKCQPLAEKCDNVQLYDLNKAQLETLINNTCEYCVQIIEICLDIIVTNKILKELDQHMFYLFESPESTTAKEEKLETVSDTKMISIVIVYYQKMGNGLGE
ncbi:unnamed protein product [Brachionus calyciflorus]|uniref:C2 domain-containing protein n=1 Tax=Brachionus calyciflorus TaxID=104777 RepID=A0A813TVY0_9BILA|nr:unnamed protein product [Brachionus calyciflorus]